MKLKLTYDLGEGPVHVETNLFVIVAWERKYKRKASDMSANGVGVEDLAFMAHQAALQQGLGVPAILDDFIKRCQSLDVVSEEPARPTEAISTDAV
jgi:hypothetical protein